MVKGYASDWRAVKSWFGSTDTDLAYLKNKVGNASITASQIRKIIKNGEEEVYGASPLILPFTTALNKFLNNTLDNARKVSEDEDGVAVYRKDVVFVEEQDIGARSRNLKEDYERPAFLENLLRH